MLAQETYQDTKFAENSLTGTARYVGMGGAMEALGADISTISSNPAGLGLFRKSMASFSAGVVAQPGADTELNFDKTPFGFDGKKSVPSFDQIGFVWAATNGDSNVKLNRFSTITRAQISLRFFLQPIISTEHLKPNGLLPRRLTLKNWMRNMVKMQVMRFGMR